MNTNMNKIYSEEETLSDSSTLSQQGSSPKINSREEPQNFISQVTPNFCSFPIEYEQRCVIQGYFGSEEEDAFGVIIDGRPQRIVHVEPKCIVFYITPSQGSKITFPLPSVSHLQVFYKGAPLSVYGSGGKHSLAFKCLNQRESEQQQESFLSSKLMGNINNNNNNNTVNEKEKEKENFNNHSEQLNQSTSPPLNTSSTSWSSKNESTRFNHNHHHKNSNSPTCIASQSRARKELENQFQAVFDSWKYDHEKNGNSNQNSSRAVPLVTLQDEEYLDSAVATWIHMESRYRTRVNIMDYQIELAAHHRIRLCGWLFEVAGITSTPLFIVHSAINLLDRILPLCSIPAKYFQAFGIVCLFIADKLHNPCSASLEHYADMTANTYSEAFLKLVETKILKMINFSIPPFTTIDLIHYFLRQHRHLIPQAELLAHFAVMDHVSSTLRMSRIALSACYLAASCQEDNPLNLETLLNEACCDRLTFYQATDCFKDRVLEYVSHVTGCQSLPQSFQQLHCSIKRSRNEEDLDSSQTQYSIPAKRMRS